MANQHDDRMPRSEEEIEDRRQFILKCKLKSWSFDRIAEEVEAVFGYKISASMCAADFRLVMRRRAEELAEDTDSMRALMLGQVDNLLSVALAKAEGGDLDALDMCIKLFQRKSRIAGLDAPTKVEREDVTPRLSREQMLERIEAIKSKLLGPRKDEPVNIAVDAVTVEVVGEQSNVQLSPDVPQSEQSSSSRSEPADTE